MNIKVHEDDDDDDDEHQYINNNSYCGDDDDSDDYVYVYCLSSIYSNTDDNRWSMFTTGETPLVKKFLLWRPFY